MNNYNMKIIFLDIDGVLNSESLSDKLYHNGIKEYGDDGVYNFIDENIVNKLTNLCKIYDIKIVISSSWRHFYFEDTIKEFKSSTYKKIHPLIPYIIGQTPRIYIPNENGYHEQVCRGKEIEEWISRVCESFKPDKYVILDDDSDILDYQFKYFIHIDNKYGLTDYNFAQIKTILQL